MSVGLRQRGKNSKPKDSAAGRATGMKSQSVVVSVALLALCCLLIPRGGESAGGIVSLRQHGDEKQAGDQLQNESLDDPESEQGVAEDPHPLGSSSKVKRDTEEAAQAGEWKINLHSPIKALTRLQRCSGVV